MTDPHAVASYQLKTARTPDGPTCADESRNFGGGTDSVTICRTAGVGRPIMMRRRSMIFVTRAAHCTSPSNARLKGLLRFIEPGELERQRVLADLVVDHRRGPMIDRLVDVRRALANVRTLRR
jgi:hypothetical protein